MGSTNGRPVCATRFELLEIRVDHSAMDIVVEDLRTVAIAHLNPDPRSFEARSTLYDAVLMEEKTMLSLQINDRVVIVVWDPVNSRYTEWEFGADQAAGFGAGWEVSSCFAHSSTRII